MNLKDATSRGKSLKSEGDAVALRPMADSWDGPFFRPFQCGIRTELVLHPPHAHFLDAMEPEGVWLMTLAGFGYHKVGNDRVRLEAGRALVLRKPDQGWLVRRPEGLPWRYIYVHVTGEKALGMFDYLQRRFGTVQTIPLESAAVRLARELVLAARKQPFRSAHFWSVKTFQWMDAWWESVTEAEPAQGAQMLDVPGHPSRLVSFTQGSIKNFAKRLGYSRSHLSRKLKAQWNESPGKILRQVRLEEAARLLRQTESKVAEIAIQVGFAAPTSFSRAFSKQFGESPAQYRHNHR